MDEDKNIVDPVVDPNTATSAAKHTTGSTTEQSQVEKISEIDRLSLDLSKTKRELALADAKTAVSNSEKAELAYRYFILKLYMKYHLTESDAITEGGDIIRGGANFTKTGS
jgi:hypothetical protein